MTKIEKLLEKLIAIEEEIIDELMASLKPELQEKVIWQFTDETIKGEEKGSWVRARINHFLKPALITFFTKTIVLGHIEDLKNLIGHEVGHLFAGSNDDLASRLETSKKIFQDNVKT